jgi:hypothetical protein
MDRQEAEAALETALVALERADEGDGMLLTGWIVVAEFVDSDGAPLLAGFARTGMPYWRIDGLVTNAVDTLCYVEEDDSEELD